MRDGLFCGEFRQYGPHCAVSAPDAGLVTLRNAQFQMVQSFNERHTWAGHTLLTQLLLPLGALPGRLQLGAN